MWILWMWHANTGHTCKKLLQSFQLSRPLRKGSPSWASCMQELMLPSVRYIWYVQMNMLCVTTGLDCFKMNSISIKFTKKRHYSRPSPQDMWRYVLYSCMYVFAPGQLGRLSSNCNYCKPFRHLKGWKKRQRGCPNWRRSCSAQMQWLYSGMLKEWAESGKDRTIYMPFCSSFLTDMCSEGNQSNTKLVKH